MGLDRQLGFVTKPPDALTLGVYLNRKGRDFSIDQRTLLDILRPHLLRAYTSARAHARLLKHLDAALEQAGVAAGGGG